MQRQEDLGVLLAQALQGDHLAPDGGHPRHDPELQALPDHVRADLLGAREQHRGHVRGLLGQTAVAGLDDAGLLLCDGRGGLPEVAGVVHRDRRTTATVASATLVASQVPPMPTSTTATSTGASANAA